MQLSNHSLIDKSFISANNIEETYYPLLKDHKDFCANSIKYGFSSNISSAILPNFSPSNSFQFFKTPILDILGTTNK